MNRILILIFTGVLNVSCSYGQERSLDALAVGFYCGISGKQTQVVKKMSELIEEKKYHKISSFLNSKNSGERYLSLLILERLSDNELYPLNENQKKRISQIKASNMIVVDCWGCFMETYSIKEMFKKDIGEKKWLDKMLPTSIKTTQ